jgi:hypothetical protein
LPSLPFCHLLFVRINFIKTSQIKAASVQGISRSIHYDSLSWQCSAWKGSSAIMHIQSPSLFNQWSIHHTFILCPLSSVSLCLSLPSLSCYERWKKVGGVTLSPPISHSPDLFIN